jgi:hypothetical protein
VVDFDGTKKSAKNSMTPRTWFEPQGFRPTIRRTPKKLDPPCHYDDLRISPNMTERRVNAFVSRPNESRADNAPVSCPAFEPFHATLADPPALASGMERPHELHVGGLAQTLSR